jgi:Flp pilus assembly protein TadG
VSARPLAVQRGQNTVEAALGMYVLLMLTVGVVDLGRAVWIQNTVAYLAREGARHGVAPNKTCAEMKTHVLSRATLADFTADLTTCDFGSGNIRVVRGVCDDLNSPVVVTARAPFYPAMQLFADMWPGGFLMLEGISRMYVEKGVPGVGACP